MRPAFRAQPAEGKFRTLVVDVPWEYDNDFLGRGAPQYALMGPWKR